MCKVSAFSESSFAIEVHRATARKQKIYQERRFAARSKRGDTSR